MRQAGENMNHDYPLIDESIDEQGDDYVAEEKMICHKYMNSDERLLAVFSGNVDQENELDRMMLTDKRAVLYSRGESQPARSFRYSEIESAKTKKGKLLTHLGEITIHAKGEIVTLKNVQAQYLNYIVDTFSRMKTIVQSSPSATLQYCTNCGNPMKQGDKFCTNCGKNLS
jgi:hypothetical protein